MRYNKIKSKTLFTADPHFGHHNIIRYCNRPFSSVEEMDSVLIRNWNSVVTEADTVYLLGDFSYHRDQRALDVFNQLNAERIILIRGNHDPDEVVERIPWDSVHDYLEVTVDRTRLVLSHYPFLSWRGVGRGSLNLYGHVHGKSPGTKQSQDVGVDCFNFTPVTLSTIIRRMRTNPDIVSWEQNLSNDRS